MTAPPMSRRAPARPRTRVAVATVALAAVLLAACGDDEKSNSSTTPKGSGSATENTTTGCVENVAAGADVFPQKATIEQAENFTLTYHGNYKILTVKEPYQGGSPESYVLVQCGTTAPTDLNAPAPVAATIQVPIKKILTGSTTHLPFIEQIGRVESIAGVSGLGMVSSKAVLDRKASIVDYAPNYEVDTEKVLAAGADGLMTGGTDDKAYKVLRDAKLPVVANAEWLETTPLGRAEWIKYVAALYNEEAAATTQFDAVVAQYKEVSAKAAKVAAADRPTVMTGSATKGTFYAAGGKSYVAQLVADAGGAYVWADDPSNGSLTLDLEAQLAKGAHAKIWINGSPMWTSKAAIAAQEPRYANFAAFGTGQIWVFNKIQNENGGVDYYERGVSRPDLVLADLLKIFHPNLATDHQFEWYQQVGS